MSDFLLFAAIGAALGLGWYLLRTRRRVEAPAPTPPAVVAPPSIHDQIKAQLTAAPAQKIPDFALSTDDAEKEGSLRFVAGAEDALFGTSEESSWRPVLDALRAVRDRHITKWRELDAITSVARASNGVDQLLEALEKDDLAPHVRNMLWTLARKSRRAESVKWGMAIGSVGMQETEVETLLVLAVHAEFTLYAAHALFREGAREPRYRQKLVELLPRVRQWGVVRVIDYIVVDETLVRDPVVQRKLVVHGMQNNDGIPNEVALTIAKAVDVRRLIGESMDDPRLFNAMVDLISTLLDLSNPLGNLKSLDGWEGIWHAWLALLQRIPSSTRVMWSLFVLEAFLALDDESWPLKESETAHVVELLAAKLSVGALRSGLRDPEERTMALPMIVNFEVRELLPELRALFAQNPDADVIDALGELGATPELELLRQAIPRFVDLEARAKVPFSAVDLKGRELRAGVEYGNIVMWLGRLATPAAVATIRTALADYDPRVRGSACRAVSQLPIGAIDASIVELVKQRLREEHEFVSEAASMAADAHGIDEE